MTADEAQREYDEAVPEPISEQEIESIFERNPVNGCQEIGRIDKYCDNGPMMMKPMTLMQRLSQREDVLTQQLADVKAAIQIISDNPGVQQSLEALAKVGL